jgi:hypothetical protein
MNDNSYPKLEKGEAESEMTLANFKLKEKEVCSVEQARP